VVIVDVGNVDFNWFKTGSSLPEQALMDKPSKAAVAKVKRVRELDG
jgi:hypothetical protein